MGALSLLLLVIGGFLVGLIAVAALVAAWEWLRQREALEMLRRDRATFAATSPLPLAAAANEAGGDSPARQRAAESEPGASPGAPPPPGPPGAPLRREASWIETRPMVLSYAPAFDDETVALREPDLRLD